MENNLLYKVNITDTTLMRLKEIDENSWFKLMFCALTESNEKLVNALKDKSGNTQNNPVSQNGRVSKESEMMKENLNLAKEIKK